MDQPLVDLLNMEDMLTRQHSNAIPLHELGQADRALVLHLEPGHRWFLL
jgi:hypothetical protein